MSTKIKWKIQACFTLYCKFWEGTYVKSDKMQLPVLLCLCFTSVFISADIIFSSFLELHSALSKNDFRRKFSFFNGFTKPLTPLNGQNLLSLKKVSCQFSLKCLLKYIFFSKIYWQNPTKASFMYQQWTATVHIYLNCWSSHSCIW